MDVHIPNLSVPLPLRRPWCNREPDNDIRNHGSACPNRFFADLHPDFTCGPLDRHWARRTPTPGSRPPALGVGSSNSTDRWLVAAAVAGGIRAAPNFPTGGEAISPRSVRCADRAANHREDSNDGTHDTKSAPPPRWRMGSKPVRVFPDLETGLYRIGWRANGRRLTRSLKHRD